MAAVMVTGCSSNDDDDDGGQSSNYIEYNNKTHSIVRAGQQFWGHYYGNGSNNITLQFLTDNGNYVVFEMFVPNSATKLVSGTYEPSGGFEPLTVGGGAVFGDADDDEPLYEMEDGFMTVEVKGNVYNISIEGTLENGTRVKGSYSGQLEYSDET